MSKRIDFLMLKIFKENKIFREMDNIKWSYKFRATKMQQRKSIINSIRNKDREQYFKDVLGSVVEKYANTVTEH